MCLCLCTLLRVHVHWIAYLPSVVLYYSYITGSLLIGNHDAGFWPCSQTNDYNTTRVNISMYYVKRTPEHAVSDPGRIITGMSPTTFHVIRKLFLPERGWRCWVPLRDSILHICISFVKLIVSMAHVVNIMPIFVLLIKCTETRWHCLIPLVYFSRLRCTILHDKPINGEERYQQQILKQSQLVPQFTLFYSEDCSIVWMF